MTIFPKGKRPRPYPGFAQSVMLLLVLAVLQTLTGMVQDLAGNLVKTPFLKNAIGDFLNAGSYSAVFLIALRAGRLRPRDIFPIPVTGGKVNPAFAAAIAITAAGMVLLLSAVDDIVQILLPMPRFFRELFQGLTSGRDYASSMLAIAVLPSILEETLFRGLILGGFLERYRPAAAVLLSSLLFSLFHLNPWQSVATFLVGISIGYIFYVTGSVVPGIIMHFLNNGLAVTWIFMEKTGAMRHVSWFNADNCGPAALQPFPLVFAAAALFIAGMAWTVILSKKKVS